MSTPSLRPIDADWTNSGVISALKRLAGRGSAKQLVDSNPWLFMTCWEEAMAISGLCNRKLACTRIKLGAFLEEQAVSESETLMEPGTVVLSNLTVKGRVAQLYFDAYATAVWTSAHAEYLAGVEAGIEEPPAPNVFAVPSAFTSMDLSDLYSRRLHPKSCPKATSPLLQLVARSTNPGARGWDPVLEASLKTPGIRRVITREYEVCLSGLHPQLHPALRPNWQKRFNIIRVIAEKCSNDATNACIMKLAVQSKEVVRRMLASTMANSTAMHTALSRLGHPVRHLCQPPIQLPHAGMEAAMVAFVQAGASLAAGTYTLLHEAVAAKFVRAQRRADGLQWAMGWLGKGTMDVASRTTLVDIAGDVWATAFKSNFISLWMHGMSKKLRISRLDPVQHSAVHSMNAVTKLCAALTEDDQLMVQRLVLQDPAAPTRTMAEVASILGILGESSIPNSFKNAPEAISVLATLGESNAAKLLAYARAAWVREQVVVVDFGDDVRLRQVETLMRRMRRKPTGSITDAYRVLPTHATCLCICTECQRVTNAHVFNCVADKPAGVFNEIGVSQSMIRWQYVGKSDKDCMHCSKRSSAALRTAMTFQEYMRKRKIEDEEVDDEALNTLMAPRAATSVESGIAARVRRDAKNALEQRAVAAACGDSTMLTIPLVGRALRVYDSWYSLCSYCAAVTRVTAAHRYGSEVCCLRCDHQMLYRAEDGEGLVEKATEKMSERVCRYCGFGAQCFQFLTLHLQSNQMSSFLCSQLTQSAAGRGGSK